MGKFIPGNLLKQVATRASQRSHETQAESVCHPLSTYKADFVLIAAILIARAYFSAIELSLRIGF
jgi:hypothetical protein